MRASLLVTNQEEGEFVFLWYMLHYSKWTSTIAAVIWTIYQRKMIEQNGTFEITSRQRLQKNVLLHVTQRRQYGGYALLQQCPMPAALGRIAFIPQMDRARVLWVPYWDHVFRGALVHSRVQPPHSHSPHRLWCHCERSLKSQTSTQCLLRRKRQRLWPWSSCDISQKWGLVNSLGCDGRHFCLIYFFLKAPPLPKSCLLASWRWRRGLYPVYRIGMWNVSSGTSV